MKPVFADYFMGTANTNNGECVVTIFHKYPLLEGDEQQVGGTQPEVITEKVASIVMTQKDAKILADLLTNMRQKLEQPVRRDGKQSLPNRGGGLN